MKNIPEIIWPARRRARDAEAAREKAAADIRLKVDMANHKQQEEAQAHLRAYQQHVKAFDLNGVATHGGRPMKASQIAEEVEKRIRLAVRVKSDACIKTAIELSDEELTSLTGKLDQTALYWVLENGDSKRQRKAAETLMNGRANFMPPPSLEAYAIAIGEAAARLRIQNKQGHVVFAVIARALLLRSASPKWDKLYKGSPIPLSSAP